MDEVRPASAYFARRGVHFFPHFAFIADYELAKMYLDHALPQEMLERASRELLLPSVGDLISRRPEDYRCPQFSILTIDEYCNILTCCLLSKADPDYSLGSLFRLSKREIEQGKLERNICKECLHNGISYWVNNVQSLDSASL